ncbi:MAG: undecaprenyldiphospho-muramoylpentapeptide beta-N-acetylglucosaminyltransferase [Planctomycetales bacterium]
MAGGSTIYFAGGGTGGHLFPGLAVAQEWRIRSPEDVIVFAGSDRGLERKIVESAGFEFRSLPAVSLAHALRSPLRFLSGNWTAYRTARQWLRVERPRGIVGLGGYAIAPLVLAAQRQKIPVVLLEQNVIPGRTNRWLARRATKVCCAFPDSARHFPLPERSVWTGNPVRQEIAALHQAALHQEERPPQEPPVLLILGGSLGAVAVNRLCLQAAERIPEFRTWKIMHQTGEQDFENVRTEYERLGIAAEVAPFFDRMEQRYAAATLSVSRAGGTTLAELSCAGIPTLLVPYPHAADDHQMYNGKYYADRGGAVLHSQAEWEGNNAELFCQTLNSLMATPDKLVPMRNVMSGLAKPRATQEVADVLRQVMT